MPRLYFVDLSDVPSKLDIWIWTLLQRVWIAYMAWVLGKASLRRESQCGFWSNNSLTVALGLQLGPKTITSNSIPRGSQFIAFGNGTFTPIESMSTGTRQLVKRLTRVDSLNELCAVAGCHNTRVSAFELKVYSSYDQNKYHSITLYCIDFTPVATKPYSLDPCACFDRLSLCVQHDLDLFPVRPVLHTNDLIAQQAIRMLQLNTD